MSPRLAPLVSPLLAALVLPPFAAGLATAAVPDSTSGYLTPPPRIAEVLEHPPLPLVAAHPGGQILMVHREGLPPLRRFAEPALQIGGLRINPRSYSSLRAPRYTGLTLARANSRITRRVNVPGDGVIGFPLWAPDGSAFAFSLTRADGVELWLGDPETGSVRPLTEAVLNAVQGAPCTWMPDSRRLLCRLVLAAGAGAQESTPVLGGPLVKETDGGTGPPPAIESRFTPSAEALFEGYLSARLAFLDTQSGSLSPIGPPRVFTLVRPSPTGTHLLVSRALPPYSPALALERQAQSVEIWDEHGKRLRSIARLPALEPGASAVELPRAFGWHGTMPDRVVWAEPAADTARETPLPFRDRLMELSAPFAGEPRELMRTEYRFSGLEWVDGTQLALVREYDRRARHARSWIVDTHLAEPQPSMLWERSIDDRYRDPGAPLSTLNERGQRVVMQHGGAIYLRGAGATESGKRPFLDRLQLDTRVRERIWQSQPGSYETVADLPGAGDALLLRRESSRERPHYVFHSLRGGSRRVVQPSQEPTRPQGYRQRLLHYRREDGVALSAILYLPENRNRGERLPLIMWAYPRNYGDAAAASQTRASPHRFPYSGGFPALNLLPASYGYAVLDQVAMPIIGNDGNDAFVEQVVANARAAVDAVTEFGVADPERIAIGGHSYGAFLAANLLAHTELFRAGIAMSGSYNRTLTPFGFQTERRTLWEAAETYIEMSPFMFADRIRDPLLLIHGEMDDHAGTPAMQSSRLYTAIRHHGGTAKLVILPYEGHVYRARESVLHVATEIIDWLDRHLKDARPRDSQ